MGGRLPLVVILGATGSGKTKLSLELAQKFSGEIIGADSMQVYKGLDIITAKATKVEQSIAQHHLIDILDPHETFTVLEYRNEAVKIIDSLISKNKLPIVVGGTNYYIESLLWKILVEEVGSNRKILPHLSSNNNDHTLSSNELHEKLKLLDPNMAKRLHPNNKRKILRSLEVLSQKGKKHSEILQEQQSSEGGSQYGGGLRYSNALVFRLQCEKNVLDERLNKRVDKMIEEGLVEELTNFHKKYNESRLTEAKTPDYTKGVFQSIGFKEFHEYLMLDANDRSSESGSKIFNDCVELLKMATRRYSRKQNKWITNRFLARADRKVPPVFGLDVTDLSQWETNVTLPAFKIIESFILGAPCPHQQLPFIDLNSHPNSQDDTFYCEICERTFVGTFQWNDHKQSNRHRKMVERKNKLQKMNVTEDSNKAPES